TTIILWKDCCSDCICLHITVSTALPTASVKIVTPQSLLYPGETVTLQCDISNYTDWTYRWFRDNHNLPSQTSKAIDITIPITQTGQVSQYRCEGLRTGRPQRSQPSVVVTISVTVKIVTPQSLLYPGETVTLQCDISDYTDWTYRWFRDNHHLPSQTSKAIDITIPITQTGQAGQYRCEGLRTDRPQRSQPSVVVTISVTALPKTTLTVKPNPAFTGETVTLMCSVTYASRWNYQWYKDRNYNVVSQSVRHTITGNTLTISRAAESDQGLYWCEGNRVSRPTSSQPGDPVTLTVEALPKTTLTVKPNPAFTGETVTLMCSVTYASRWNYQWYKDRNYNVVSQSVRHTITGNTLTISRAAESDQGLYWCEGNRVSRPTSSQPGDPVTLTVEGELLCVFCHKDGHFLYCVRILR
uniref:Ig-like domain-containing protein n=1 Tax=Oncorhynchus tshawytscha TaxID=74940 RepID=A0AAZ3SX93_ONCTS